MPQQITALRKSARSLLILAASIAIVTANLMSAYAAQLTSASLELGDSRPGETTTYTFDASGFTTGTTIRCIQLQIDTQADGAGGVPSGFSNTSGPATLDSSSLITAGSWTQDNSTNGVLEITNTTGETPAANGDIVWGSVVNGDTDATTYYAIFTSYTDDACTGGNEVDQVTVAFIYTDGSLVTLTIDPTLSFTCSGVALGQDVQPNSNPGGTDTTVGSTGTLIDFGSAVTSASNGVSAHDLQVDTNATGGYVIYIRHTGDLQNGASDTITAHTGTNGTPTAFTAAGTESWGYTTDDNSLTGGTANRFTNSGEFWAGFTTTNQPVVDNPTATAGSETTRVGHQVGVASTTEAGTYNTTIVYTMVATY